MEKLDIVIEAKRDRSTVTKAFTADDDIKASIDTSYEVNEAIYCVPYVRAQVTVSLHLKGRVVYNRDTMSYTEEGPYSWRIDRVSIEILEEMPEDATALLGFEVAYTATSNRPNPPTFLFDGGSSDHLTKEMKKWLGSYQPWSNNLLKEGDRETVGKILWNGKSPKIISSISTPFTEAEQAGYRPRKGMFEGRERDLADFHNSGYWDND